MSIKLFDYALFAILIAASAPGQAANSPGQAAAIAVSPAPTSAPVDLSTVDLDRQQTPQHPPPASRTW